MTFFGMLMARVDPFAVYAAERELANHGISVPHNILTTQYLVRGQLRTIVKKLVSRPENQTIQEAAGAAILEGPDESKNPRFVAPFLTGAVYGAGVILAIAILGAFHLAGHVPVIIEFNWVWAAAAAAILVGICMVYGYLGAKIGRVKANNFLVLALALTLVGCIYWGTKYLDAKYVNIKR
jgi:hypothetical protein